MRLWYGRRYKDGPPHGWAYKGKRWGYMHPVPSIYVLFLGPVWIGVTK
jgi:hypothetical protein